MTGASNDRSTFPLRRIISGGQSGVDRGALLAAIELGIPHGGWCPHGRLAEDGPIDQRFQLLETESSQYHVRTERNVTDSDGTLIIHRGPLTGGTALTERFARQHGKYCLLVDLQKPVLPAEILAWIAQHCISVLNIAGPRESSIPGIQEDTRQLVCQLFGCARELTRPSNAD